MAVLVLGGELVAVELDPDGGGRTTARSAAITVVNQPEVRGDLPPALVRAAAEAEIIQAVAGSAAEELATGRTCPIVGLDRRLLASALGVFPLPAEREAALGWRRVRALVASRDGRRFIGWLAQTLARTRRRQGVRGDLCRQLCRRPPSLPLLEGGAAAGRIVLSLGRRFIQDQQPPCSR